MIRLIDNTLSGMDAHLQEKEDLKVFCELLFLIGVDMIELSVEIYERMEELPAQGKYILVIDFLEQMDIYPGFYRYVCRQMPGSDKVMNELQINDMRELVRLRTLDGCRELRIVGLDDLLCRPYEKIMKEFRYMLPRSRINFCPQNTFGCAGALAIQWILNGGYDITTSFAGYRNNAPTEEVLMTLRLAVRHKPNRNLSVLPQLTSLFEILTQSRIGNKKPIIGRNIFKVEAGIHADGLIKNPATYEAYEPGCVGGKTEVIIGKHSGIQAIRYKMQEMNMTLPGNGMAEVILHRVKHTCLIKRNSLMDEEFRILASEVITGESAETYC